MLLSRCFHHLLQSGPNFPKTLPLLKSWYVRLVSCGIIWSLSFQWTAFLPVTFFCFEMLYDGQLSKLSRVLVYREKSAWSVYSRPAFNSCWKGITRTTVEFGRTFWDSPLQVYLEIEHSHQLKICKNIFGLRRVRLFADLRNSCPVDQELKKILFFFPLDGIQTRE